jgi:uncharacterized protein YvpB
MRMRSEVATALLAMVALGACGGAGGAPQRPAAHGAAAASAAPPGPPAGAPAPGPTATEAPLPASNVLDVPLHLQEQRATCEVAALLMALQWRGITTGERTLLALTGIDGRPAVGDGSGGIARWGDPGAAFVGDPNGNPPDHTGYGVYAAPIARAARASGANVLAAGTGISPSAVYAAVLGGHPVVAWVTNDYQPGALRTWLAWDGAEVGYSLKEHAVLVIGVSPDQVLLDDPWYGRRWHARTEFEGAYGTFGDMAVVVG